MNDNGCQDMGSNGQSRIKLSSVSIFTMADSSDVDTLLNPQLTKKSDYTKYSIPIFLSQQKRLKNDPPLPIPLLYTKYPPRKNLTTDLQ